MDTFTTRQLLQVLDSLHRPSRFLLDRFFPNVIVFGTAEVSFDLGLDNLTLAPFCSPLVAGKAEKARGRKTSTFTPAYLKPKTVVDPRTPLIRVPGESYDGSMSPGERRNLTINQIMGDHMDQIVRRLEWMAAQVLKTGKVIVSGEDYETTEVDFSRDAALSPSQYTGGARWGETGVSASDDLEERMAAVGESVGAAVSDVVLGKTAWKHLKADEKFQKSLDRQFGQANSAELGIIPGNPGVPQQVGTANGVNYYLYNAIYKDAAGATQKMIDDDGVIMAATGAIVGTQLYGAILDGASGYAEAQFFPKNWISDDPALEWVMTQSAPLVAPGRINATSYIRVRAAS